jgi:hypothetical protein
MRIWRTILLALVFQAAMTVSALAAYNTLSNLLQNQQTLTPLTTGGASSEVLIGNSGPSVGYSQVLVQVFPNSSVTGGAIRFQGSKTGSGGYANLQSWEIVDPTSASFAPLSMPYTLVASTSKLFLLYIPNYASVEIAVSSAITGVGGSVAINIVASPAASAVSLLPGSNTAGKFNILGNAGATLDAAPGGASTNALTVQGNAAGAPVPISAASLPIFIPAATSAAGRLAAWSVTTSSSVSGALPAAAVAGATLIINNTGSYPMYCNVYAAGDAATTNDQQISAGSGFAFTLPASPVPPHCIAVGGTTTANGTAGSGTPAAWGGGGGSGSFVWPGTASVTNFGVAPTGTVPAVNASASQPTPANLNATVVGGGGAPLATAQNQEVTAAGTSAASAQGIQGVTNGVPTPVIGVSGGAPMAVKLNSTPSLANGNGTVPTQGGAVLSSTNGTYTNILLDNNPLSASNALPNTIWGIGGDYQADVNPANELLTYDGHSTGVGGSDAGACYKRATRDGTLRLS